MPLIVSSVMKAWCTASSTSLWPSNALVSQMRFVSSSTTLPSMISSSWISLLQWVIKNSKPLRQLSSSLMTISSAQTAGTSKDAQKLSCYTDNRAAQIVAYPSLFHIDAHNLLFFDVRIYWVKIFEYKFLLLLSKVSWWGAVALAWRWKNLLWESSFNLV